MAEIGHQIAAVLALSREQVNETRGLVDDILGVPPADEANPLERLVNAVLGHGEEVDQPSRLQQAIKAIVEDQIHDQVGSIIHAALESQHLGPDPLQKVVDAIIASPLIPPPQVKPIIAVIAEMIDGRKSKTQDILTSIVRSPSVSREAARMALDTFGCAITTDTYYEELMRNAWKSANRTHGKNYMSLVSRRNGFQEFYYGRLRNQSPREGDLGCRVSIAELQRMQLRAFHTALVTIASELQLDTNVMRNVGIGPRGKALSRLLRDYTEAVRDYEYMISASQGQFDYFIASAERYYDRIVLEKIMLTKHFKDLADPDNFDVQERHKVTYDSLKNNAAPVGQFSFKRSPLGGPRNEVVRRLFRQAFLSRLVSAFVGGVFLIGPMWLLTLKRNLYVNLGAATGFIAAFGSLMVLFMDKVGDVFAATLAYAAVIMVFVGVMFDKQFTDD